MKPSIIVFPGSNCDRDIAVAIKNVTNITPNMLWHKETIHRKYKFNYITRWFFPWRLLKIGFYSIKSSHYEGSS